MKYIISYKYIVLFAALSMVFSSCEKVVDINLEPGESQMTVDAVITNDTSEQQIRLSMSLPYLNNSRMYPAVTNATVAVLDLNTFDTFIFKHAGDGFYRWKPDAAKGDTLSTGHRYLLVVATDKDTFYSVSNMNRTADIDSLVVEELPESLGRKAGKYVELFSKDKPGRGDLYWFRTYVNGKFKGLPGDINTAYDGAFAPGDANDGIQFIVPISFLGLNDFQNPYVSGDRIAVEILGITPEFFYFLQETTIQTQNGGLFATPPSNVKSNILNYNTSSKKKANGFFVACSLKKATVTIP